MPPLAINWCSSFNPPKSGPKRPSLECPLRSKSGLVRCRKQPHHLRILSAYASNVGGEHREAAMVPYLLSDQLESDRQLAALRNFPDGSVNVLALGTHEGE